MNDTGYHYQWLPDPGWRLADPGEHKFCRFQADRKGCGRPAIAFFWRVGNRRSGWWGYCEEHLYGRRIREGVVEWRVVRPDEPVAEEAGKLKEEASR